MNCRKTKEFRVSPVSATITFHSQRVNGTFNLYDNLFDSGTQIWGRYFHPLSESVEYYFEVHYHATCNQQSKNKLYRVDITDGFMPKDPRQNDGTCVFETTAFSWYMGDSVPTIVVAYKGYEKLNPHGRMLHYWEPLACAPVVARREDFDVLDFGWEEEYP